MAEQLRSENQARRPRADDAHVRLEGRAVRHLSTVYLHAPAVAFLRASSLS
jgi:hypothetical protein